MFQEVWQVLTVFACLLIATDAKSLAEIDRVFDLLDQAQEEVKLSGAKDVILVVGGVGSGKTTFVEWITGDNKNLNSIESSRDSGEFIIKDTNGRIGSSSVPTTLFPEYSVDEESETVFYDCPGFSVGRNTSHNIAASHLIKQLTDNTKNVKIVFVTSVHTVKKGVDSESFKKFLKNAKDLIKNFDKYRDSIALVVTKVDNVVVKRGDSYEQIPDSSVIEGVIEFLVETKLSLIRELEGYDNNKESQNFIESALEFIEILLTSRHGIPTRIAIFRRPERSGLLSDIASSQLGKGRVHEMLENLVFTQTSEEDFGHVISDYSRLVISSLITEISEEIAQLLDEQASIVLEGYKRIVDAVKVTLADNETLQLSDMEELYKALNDGQKKILDFLKDLSNISDVEMIPEIVSQLFVGLKIDINERSFQELTKLITYLEFLQSTISKPASFKLSTENKFQENLNFLLRSIQAIREEATAQCQFILDVISLHMKSISDEIEGKFKSEIDRIVQKTKSFVTDSKTVDADLLEARAFHEKLSTGEEELSQLADKLKSLPTLYLLSDAIRSTLERLHIELPENVLNEISESSQKFKFIETLTNSQLKLPSDEWANHFAVVADYLSIKQWKSSTDYTEQEIFLLIEFSISDIVEILIKTFDAKVATLEIAEINAEVSKWHEVWSLLVNGFGQIASIQELADKLSSSVAITYINDSQVQHNLQSITTFGKYLAYMKALSNDFSDTAPSKQWKPYLENLSDFLQDQRQFHLFLDELLEALSQYSVQIQRSWFDVEDLDEWGKEPTSCSMKNRINIGKNNFEAFLEKISSFNIESLEAVKNVIPTDTQFAALNKVLSLTLKHKMDMACDGEAITLKANFLKFTDFLKLDGKLNGCDWTNKTLNVFVLKTLFIDQDLNAVGDRLKLNVIAAKWETIGTRKILLDGEVGKTLSKAATGSAGGKGSDGAPGNPGGPGGVFFGIGDEFVNSESLMISSNGGSGGLGQAGGDGGSGTNGKNAINFDIWCDHDRMRRDGFTITQTNYWRVGKDDYFQYRLNGQAGTAGGAAGKCGVGGLGGAAGKILVKSLSTASEISQKSVASSKGANGAVGAVGKGGKFGNNFVTECINQFRGVGNYHWLLNYEFKFYTVTVNTYAANGQAASGCSTTQGRQPDTLIVPFDANDIFTDFTSFLIESLNDRYGRHFAKQFSKKLQDIDEVDTTFNTLGLINHLEMLSSYSQIENKDDLIPFYESHLKNIEKYAAKPKPSESSEEFKKVLSFLYTATLSKLSNLKNDPDSDHIIDISGYLDMVSQNVKTLDTLQDESHLVTVVETLKKNFKNEIDKKIEEAQGLIEDTVTPEFDKIGSQFDVQISGLVNETIALQNAAKEEKAALEAKKKQLENSMSNGIFGKVLKVFSKVCSFFGPIGAAVGTVIDVGTTVVSSLRQGEAQELPSFESGGLTSKLEGFGNSLLDLSASIRVNRNDIREVTRGIENLEKKVKELEDFEAKIYDKLVPIIEQMGNDLINTANDLESKSSVSLDVIGWQVQGTLKDTSLEIQQFTRGFEVHESVARSVEKLEEVMKTLIKVYDRIQNYQEQQRLAVYMADLSSASAKQIIVTNPIISNSFRNLQISIQSNIILNQYDSVLNAFKQWIFPFAEVFLKEFQLPDNLISNNIDIAALASIASARIEDIRIRIQKYKTTIEDFDKHIYLAQFNGSSAIMKPFYVWKNEENREMITRLLSGETVLVKADITSSAMGKDAIKFNFVEFGLKSSDPTIQAEIDRILLNYVVSMTHLGNSNYRYNGKYFSIASSSQSMLYSVEKGTIQNNVYKKLLSGDIMLSPYAMWELRFSTNPFKSVKAFGSLESFADKVDLVLEGSGSFVNTGDTKFDAESFYKVDDSVRLMLN